MSDPRTIRFGIMCHGSTFPSWQARCIEELLKLPDVRPALLIVPAEGPPDRRRFESVATGHFLYYANHALVPPRSLRPVEMAEKLRDVPILRCRVTTRGRFSQYFEDADVHRIREYDLDFILRFAFGIIRGEILGAARFGVWSFHHDDELRYRGAPPCFWEIYENDPVTGAILQRLTHRLDGGIVLRRGSFRTSLHSLRRNVDDVFFGTVGWPANVCRDIRLGNTASLDAAPSPTSAPLRHLPTNRQMMRFLFRQTEHGFRRARRALLRHEEWCIGIVDEPIASFLQPDREQRVRWLRPPGGDRFIADPFGAQVDGATHILYEDFRYATSTGVIATVEAAATGAPRKPKVALELPVTASYPYLVEDRGEVYCVPETNQAREVGLYQAVNFPFGWEKVATLLTGVAALDSTLFRHEGRWWLTHTDRNAGQYVHLYAWHAPRLEGPWAPHPLNPVKTDVRSSRPAGTPFVHEGALYRPAQDCSRRYGGRIVINRVLRLSPTEFSEEPAAIIEPLPNSPFPEGIHTISRVGEVTLIDSKRYRFIPSAIPYVLRNR